MASLNTKFLGVAKLCFETRITLELSQLTRNILFEVISEIKGSFKQERRNILFDRHVKRGKHSYCAVKQGFLASFNEKAGQLVKFCIFSIKSHSDSILLIMKYKEHVKVEKYLIILIFQISGFVKSYFNFVSRQETKISLYTKNREMVRFQSFISIIIINRC